MKVTTDLFIMYTTDLVSLVERYEVSPHLYADDTQIYGSCSPCDVDSFLTRVSQCTCAIAEWMQSNRLQLNCGKTDFAWLTTTRSLHHGQAPLYLADDCCLVSDSTQRSLRSADVPTCAVPRTVSSYGDRTFAAAEPRLWNCLPVQLRNPDITYGLFRRQLKAHLFFGKYEHYGAL